MSSLEFGQIAKGVFSEIRGIFRPNSVYEKPVDMTSIDTMSIKGKTFSTENETARLLKRGTRKRYNPTFSKQIEQFKAWQNSLAEKLKRAIPVENTQYEALSDHVSEKSVSTSSGHVPAEQVHTAARSTHDNIHSTLSQTDALQSIRDRKQIYSSSERREADRLLDNADALKKSHETLAAREGKMSQAEFKHFEKDVQYQGNMSKKWNDDLTHLYDKIEKREKADLKKAKKKLAKQSEQKIAENAQKLEHHQILHRASQNQLDRIRAFQESSLKSKANGFRFNAQKYEQMNSLLARGNALQLDREGIIHHLLNGNTSKAEAAQLKLQNQSRQWEQEVGRFHQNSLNPHKDVLIDPNNPFPTGLDEKIETGTALRSAPPKKVRGKATLNDRLKTIEQSVRSETEQTEQQAQRLESLMKSGGLKSSRDYSTARSLLNTTKTFERTRKALNEAIGDALISEDPKQVKRLEKIVKEHLKVKKEWSGVYNRITPSSV